MGELFDDISRILASPMPRRRAFKLGLGMVAGGVLATLGMQQPAHGAQRVNCAVKNSGTPPSGTPPSCGPFKKLCPGGQCCEMAEECCLALPFCCPAGTTCFPGGAPCCCPIGGSGCGPNGEPTANTCCPAANPACCLDTT